MRFDKFDPSSFSIVFVLLHFFYLFRRCHPHIFYTSKCFGTLFYKNPITWRTRISGEGVGRMSSCGEDLGDDDEENTLVGPTST